VQSPRIPRWAKDWTIDRSAPVTQRGPIGSYAELCVRDPMCR